MKGILHANGSLLCPTRVRRLLFISVVPQELRGPSVFLHFTCAFSNIEMLAMILLYEDVTCTDYGNMWQNWVSSESVTSDESEEI
jgi:hypothetical protein